MIGGVELPVACSDLARFGGLPTPGWVWVLRTESGITSEIGPSKFLWIYEFLMKWKICRMLKMIVYVINFQWGSGVQSVLTGQVALIQSTVKTPPTATTGHTCLRDLFPGFWVIKHSYLPSCDRGADSVGCLAEPVGARNSGKCNGILCLERVL